MHLYVDDKSQKCRVLTNAEKCTKCSWEREKNVSSLVKMTYYCLVVCLFEFGEESCPFVADLWGAGVDVLFLELEVNLDCNQKH